MTEFQDWTITLTFNVPPGDTAGDLTEALFEAAVQHSPRDAAGITARADTTDGKVWITFTLVNASKELATRIAKDMKPRIAETVFSDEDACVTAA